MKHKPEHVYTTTPALMPELESPKPHISRSVLVKLPPGIHRRMSTDRDLSGSRDKTANATEMQAALLRKRPASAVIRERKQWSSLLESMTGNVMSRSASEMETAKHLLEHYRLRSQHNIATLSKVKKNRKKIKIVKKKKKKKKKKVRRRFP